MTDFYVNLRSKMKKDMIVFVLLYVRKKREEKKCEKKNSAIGNIWCHGLFRGASSGLPPSVPRAVGRPPRATRAAARDLRFIPRP